MKIFVCKQKQRIFLFKLNLYILLDQLQLKIHEKLHIPPNRQKFTNWPSKHCEDHV